LGIFPKAGNLAKGRRQLAREKERGRRNIWRAAKQRIVMKHERVK
jgi:hypothetical protein